MLVLHTSKYNINWHSIIDLIENNNKIWIIGLGGPLQLLYKDSISVINNCVITRTICYLSAE